MFTCTYVRACVCVHNNVFHCVYLLSNEDLVACCPTGKAAYSYIVAINGVYKCLAVFVSLIIHWCYIAKLWVSWPPSLGLLQVACLTPSGLPCNKLVCQFRLQKLCLVAELDLLVARCVYVCEWVDHTRIHAGDMIIFLPYLLHVATF